MGTANTGGGGGGGGGVDAKAGGSGGSGVVIVRFVRPGYLPTVSTGSAAAITGTSTTTGGEVTDSGGTTATSCGIVYAPSATNSNPTLKAAGTTTVPANGCSLDTAFSVDLTGLSPATAYSFNAYATNAEGTGYGTVGTFTTSAVHFVVSAPAAVTAGTRFSFTVTAKDANGDTATGYVGMVHFTSSDTGGVDAV